MLRVYIGLQPARAVPRARIASALTVPRLRVRFCHMASALAKRLLRRVSCGLQVLKAELKGSIQKGVEFVNKGS